MEIFIEPIGKLINEFSKLPGVGKKTAQRYAYKIIDMSEADARAFAEAIIGVKRKVKYCNVCGNFTEKETCEICTTREKEIICVVKEPKDVAAIEKLREFKGVYHVLHGAISPVNGITPDKIRFAELIERVQEGEIREVIIATNPTPDGEVTAMYISKYLKPLGVKVTRLAYGIPVGADLEYADEVTLSRALEGRKEM